MVCPVRNVKGAACRIESEQIQVGLSGTGVCPVRDRDGLDVYERSSLTGNPADPCQYKQTQARAKCSPEKLHIVSLFSARIEPTPTQSYNKLADVKCLGKTPIEYKLETTRTVKLPAFTLRFGLPVWSGFWITSRQVLDRICYQAKSGSRG